jgi:uncharacterized protein
MSGISPSLPIRTDPTYIGYVLNSSMLDVIKQNFKHLVLTSPGERMMIPDFGVGIRDFLFAPNTASTHGAIRSKITEQVEKYLPFVAIRNLQFNPPPDDSSGENLQIVIEYEIIPFETSDILLVVV